MAALSVSSLVILLNRMLWAIYQLGSFQKFLCFPLFPNFPSSLGEMHCELFPRCEASVFPASELADLISYRAYKDRRVCLDLLSSLSFLNETIHLYCYCIQYYSFSGWLTVVCLLITQNRKICFKNLFITTET